MAHQVLQQAEFARLHVNLAGTARHGAAEQVKLQISDLEPGDRRLGGGAAAERLDAGQKLGEGEGLDQIVIAPGLEAHHPLIHARKR